MLTQNTALFIYGPPFVEKQSSDNMMFNRTNRPPAQTNGGYTITRNQI